MLIISLSEFNTIVSVLNANKFHRLPPALCLNQCHMRIHIGPGFFNQSFVFIPPSPAIPIRIHYAWCIRNSRGKKMSILHLISIYFRKITTWRLYKKNMHHYIKRRHKKIKRFLLANITIISHFFPLCPISQSYNASVCIE